MVSTQNRHRDPGAARALLPAAFASGQASTGNIYGKAVDEQGGALPGVSVTLTGPGAPLTTFTDARGTSAS